MELSTGLQQPTHSDKKKLRIDDSGMIIKIVDGYGKLYDGKNNIYLKDARGYKEAEKFCVWVNAL
jgi:hypothetical protein